MAACSSQVSNKRSVSADVKTQKSEITELMKKELVKGDTWYLVGMRWWTKWKKFVGYQESEFVAGEELNDPGPIDNSSLLATDGCTLEDYLIDDLDYNVLPEEAWFKFVSWYGVISVHQTIPRKVVEYGMYARGLKVEVYLWKLRLGWKSDPEKLVARQFSMGDTIGHIMSEMRKIFSITNDVETRVWTKYVKSSYELLSDMGVTAENASIYNGQILLIEQKNEDGTWGKPRSPDSSSLTETKDEPRVVSESPIANGVANQQEGSLKRLQHELVEIRQGLDDEVRLHDTREWQLKEQETTVDQLWNTLGEEQKMKTLLEEGLQTEMLSSQARQQELQRNENANRKQQRLLGEERQQKMALEERLRNLELQMQEERNKNLSNQRELQSAVSAAQQELQRKENANREQQRLLKEERQQKTALEERLRNLELQMQEESNRNLSNLQSAVSVAQQELQRKVNANREQQRLLKEERQQKTALEERLRNLELQMQELRNRTLRLLSVVSAAQQELQRKKNANREQQRLLEEERQQKTALEERLRNLELQMQEERNRNLSNQRELQSAVSAAQAELAEYQPQNWIIQREEVFLRDDVLGKGAWGSVRLGTFRGCQVAVKEIHEVILSPHNRRLFEREMNIASCCRHPNLLQFIGATNDDGSPLFVTEILDTTLRRLLSERALNDEEIVSLALDITKGLNYLHLHRPLPIIHRDISSTNVLLWRRDEDWRAKLSDYGSANFMRQCMTVSPGAMMYSAPEALTSQQSPKLDVYSFGVLLCEMCIRELPDPQRIRDQIRQVTNGNLKKLIKRCVKINPEERPTISDMISELEGHARSRGQILTRIRTLLKF